MPYLLSQGIGSQERIVNFLFLLLLFDSNLGLIILWIHRVERSHYSQQVIVQTDDLLLQSEVELRCHGCLVHIHVMKRTSISHHETQRDFI